MELRRKSGTEAGKYKIDLRLICDDRDLKTVNFDDALDLSVLVIPENSTAPTVDGNVSSTEWEDSFLCTPLLQRKFVRNNDSVRQMKNLPAKQQTRFRFSRYQDMLYCLIDFMEDTGASFKLTKQSFDNLRNESIPDNILENLEPLKDREFTSEDEFLNAVEKQIGKEQTVRYKELILKHADTGPKDFAHIYVANDYESEPTAIIANLKEQKAFIKGSPELTVQTAVTGTKMELAVPLEILPVTEQDFFYLNVIRIAGRRETYWRGGLDTYAEPVVYGKFRFQ